VNRQEFKQIYDLLDAVYELDFKPHKLDAWYKALERHDFKKMMIAADRYIETEKYKPKPADLIRISADIRPPIKNQPDFICELCKGGYVMVEHEVETAEGPEPVVYCYRCKCTTGQQNDPKTQTITDDIINSRYRDIFGIYRLEPSSRTEVKREDFRKVAQNFGKW
jgi:hypothetical protein